MTRVHKEPLVPPFLFDFLPVPGRDEERSDNASTSPTTEDENESGRRAVPARHCGGYRREGFLVGPTKLERRGHGHAESFPYFDRRRIPDTGHASRKEGSESTTDADGPGRWGLRRSAPNRLVPALRENSAVAGRAAGELAADEPPHVATAPRFRCNRAPGSSGRCAWHAAGDTAVGSGG